MKDMEEKTKFIMVDESQNYAYDIAVYGRDFHNAKIFEGNSEDYEKYGNEIIPLKSKRGLEIMAREIEKMDPQIDLMLNKVNRMLEGRNNFYRNSPELRKYIKERNSKIHPILGISEDTKQNILNKIYEKNLAEEN